MNHQSLGRLALVACCATALLSPSARAGSPAAALDTTQAPASLRGATFAPRDEILFSEPGDGALWVRGANFKARIDGGGATVIPFFGSDAPRNFPVELRVETATVGGAALNVTHDAKATRERQRVSIDRGAFVEAYDVSGAQPKLIRRIPTGDGAHAFRARGDKRHVFVSNRVANTISLIDTQTLAVVGEYPGPGGPDCMEVLADRRTLLVSSRWARKLSFIDLESRKVVRQVDVGRSPHGVWTLDHAPRQ